MSKLPKHVASDATHRKDSHGLAGVARSHLAAREQELDEPDTAVISTTAFHNLDIVVPGQRDAEGNAVQDRQAAVPTLAATHSIKPAVMTALPLAIVDLAAMMTCFFVAKLIVIALTGWSFSPLFVYHYGAVATLYLLISYNFGLYPGSGMSPPVELRQVVCAISFTFFSVTLLHAVFATLIRVEAVVLASGWAAAVVVAPLVRFYARIKLAKFDWWGERAIVVGATTQGNAIYRFLNKNPQRGIRPVGLVDEPQKYLSDIASENEIPPSDALEQTTSQAVKYIGSPDDLAELAAKYQASWAVVAIANRSPEEIQRVLSRCSILPHMLLLPSRAAIPSLWNRSQECGGIAGIHIEDRLLKWWPQFLKRAGDLLTSAILLVVLSPLFLLIGAAIFVMSPGPVFFSQTRLGKGGRNFKVWKFRSMIVDAERVLQEKLDSDPELKRQWAEAVKMKNDPRIIPGIGDFLRKSSLDELPQLWNVLWGSMSLVGPRPIQYYEVDRYDQSYPLYCRVRPGVTGLWQVSGRNNTSYASRVTFDTYYVRNWSIWLDIYLLLRTVRTILLREGAY